MRTRHVVVGDVLPKRAAEMPLVQHDQVVQTLAERGCAGRINFRLLAPPLGA